MLGIPYTYRQNMQFDNRYEISPLPLTLLGRGCFICAILTRTRLTINHINKQSSVTLLVFL